jgi:hypothetical protein
MAVGNITNYETSKGVSETGLQVAPIGAPISGPDGWYSDGTYSYYVSSGTVQSVNYDPCYVPPPPPPPTTYDYYDYERCTGARAYTGLLITIQLVAGSTPPSSVTYGSFCYSLYSEAMSTPTNTPVSYSGTNCNCN